MTNHDLIQTVRAQTSTQAWLTCCELLLKSGPERTAFNLIVAIHDPVTLSGGDRAIAGLVDRFLLSHDSSPLVTVMNTIFPGGFYKQGGAKAVFHEFPEAYEFSNRNWGTYAGRMFTPAPRKSGPPQSRIQTIIHKLKRNLEPQGLRMRASYEVDILDSSLDEDLSLYCAQTDSDLNRGQPCLAHISFKLHTDDTLSLTAFYRSQHYITKGLGNFLGLGQLLYFVATEAGLTPGALIVHASMASIDLRTKSPSWKFLDVQHLIEDCKVHIIKPIGAPELLAV